MAKPTDAIMPILQRIQSDLADLRRDMADVKRTLASQTDKLSEMNGYLSFNLGITSRHTFEIEGLRKEGEAIKDRLRALESLP